MYNSLALTPISLSSSSFISLITKASLSLSSDGHTYPILLSIIKLAELRLLSF